MAETRPAGRGQADLEVNDRFAGTTGNTKVRTRRTNHVIPETREAESSGIY
jgi:hypothetical protein